MTTTTNNLFGDAPDVGQKAYVIGQIAVMIVAASLFASLVYTRGYPGDPNEFLDITRSGDWTGWAIIHYGYFFLLSLAIGIGGQFGLSDYVSQGLLSLVATLVTLPLLAEFVKYMTGNRLTSLITIAVFAGSGQVLVSATYGETYVLQFAFIMIASVAATRGLLALSGASVVLSLALSPLMIFMVALPISGYVRNSGFRLPDISGSRSLVIGGAAAGIAVASLAVVHDSAFFSSYFQVARSNEAINVAPASITNIRNFVLWFARGFNILAPMVILGGFLSVVRGPRWILWVWLSTVFLNAYFILKVGDYWMMMGILWIPYSLWASIGLLYLIKRLSASRAMVFSVLIPIVVVFVVFNRLDMGERGKTVAQDGYRLAELAQNKLTGSTILGSSDVISVFIHYDEEFNLEASDVDYAAGVVDPVAWKKPDSETLVRIEKALDSDRPVYLVIRTKRYDSPIMRLVFPKKLETPFRSIYVNMLPEYVFDKSIDAGEYHSVYRAVRAGTPIVDN